MPADPDSTSTTLGVAEAAAAELERYLVSQHPIIVAMGTGRMLRAMVEQLTADGLPAAQGRVARRQYRARRLGLALSTSSAASPTAVKAPHYPMPLPVIATTVHEKALLLAQKPLRNVIELAQPGRRHLCRHRQLGDDAPLLRDGFVSRDEMRALVQAGAVGEIIGWAFDADGQLIDGLTNDRVLSVPLRAAGAPPVIGVAMAMPRLRAIKGALRGKLINGLITNELMAELLLEINSKRSIQL